MIGILRELPFIKLYSVRSADDPYVDRWWYARDVRTGQEGVVPAAYLY